MRQEDSIQIPDIHIGSEIISYLKVKDISKSKLARGIGMGVSNLCHLLEKKSIETRTLIPISNFLEHNFFLLWCRDIQMLQPVYTLIDNPDCIGDKINLRMKELKMQQLEFATAIGIARSDVNRILRKTTFDTDKLAHISRILGKNFFYEYCLNSIAIQTNKDVSENDSLLINRYEKLVLENSRLKQELNDARMEIARLRYTV